MRIKGIKEAIELPMDIQNEPYIEVTLDYGRPLLGYRLIDGVLYYTGRNGTKQIGKNVTLDNLAKRILSHAKNITKMNIDKIEVDDKVIWDYADGFINESIKEDTKLNAICKLVTKLYGPMGPKKGQYNLIHGGKNAPFGIKLVKELTGKGATKDILVAKDKQELMDKLTQQLNKNESIKEDYEEDDHEDVTEEMHKEKEEK